MSEQVARREETAWFGVVLALGSAAMLFVALFFAYAFLRARSGVWPPSGLPRLPRLLPTFNLAIAIAASLLLHRARAAHRPGPLLWLALGCGALFFALQGVLWRELIAEGFTFAQTGAYGAVFYGLTFVHAAHLLVGIGGLASLLRGARRGAREHPPGQGMTSASLRLWTLYWDFVGAVWAAVVVGVIWL